MFLDQWIPQDSAKDFLSIYIPVNNHTRLVSGYFQSFTFLEHRKKLTNKLF